MTTTSTSMAVMSPRTLTNSTAIFGCTALPNLPRHQFPASIKVFSGSRRSSLFHVKASEDASSSIDTDELLADLKKKWDAVENKPTVIIYGTGGVFAIWLSSVIIGAINRVPLLPSIMELVGVGYSGWFVYRYLLFESSRKELATSIEWLKKEITES